jgi:hypothetical protein
MGLEGEREMVAVGGRRRKSILVVVVVVVVVFAEMGSEDDGLGGRGARRVVVVEEGGDVHGGSGGGGWWWLGARTESGAEVAAWDKAQNTYHSQILFPRSILRYQATLGSTSPSITNSSEIHLFIVCTSRHCGPSHTVATEGRLRVHRTHIPIMLVLQPHMTVSRSSIHSSPARQAGESSSRCFWRLIIMLAQIPNR